MMPGTPASSAPGVSERGIIRSASRAKMPDCGDCCALAWVRAGTTARVLSSSLRSMGDSLHESEDNSRMEEAHLSAIGDGQKAAIGTEHLDVCGENRRESSEVAPVQHRVHQRGRQLVGGELSKQLLGRHQGFGGATVGMQPFELFRSERLLF